jgi:hypothetical protein
VMRNTTNNKATQTNIPPTIFKRTFIPGSSI